MNDQDAVAVQLDRPLRASVEVLDSCHLGLPVVAAVPPILDDGTPFPTRYWLTCPLAVRRIARLESAGGVRQLEAFVASRPDLVDALESAHRRYEAERDALVPAGTTPAPSGGIGGNTGAGLKCLHGHYADTAAGNPNPVGDLVKPYVEPLDCDRPCVVGSPTLAPNPDWEEPR